MKKPTLTIKATTREVYGVSTIVGFLGAMFSFHEYLDHDGSELWFIFGLVFVGYGLIAWACQRLVGRVEESVDDC